MLARLSLSCLLLLVFFTTNLVNRVQAKQVNYACEISEICESEIESDQVFNLDDVALVQFVAAIPELPAFQIVSFVTSPKFIRPNPSLNLLYIANSPPA